MTLARIAARLALALSIVGAASLAQAADGAPIDYRLERRIPIVGDGGWDYLTYDPVLKQLFIARATRVQVVDPRDGSVLAVIPDAAGVHGVALARDLGKGFTSNGRENTVTVFDLATAHVTGKIPLPGARNPDAIVYDPTSKRVFTFNGGSQDATVIDAGSEQVVGTIPLGGKPEFAVADGRGTVFANIESTGELIVIDTRAAKITHRWPIAGCQGPTGLALDPAHRRLFAGCGNKIMAVIDADTGKGVATLPIGAGVDATAFDRVTGLAFASNGDGTLTVVHEDLPDHFTVAQTVPTEKGARTLALDPASHRVYLVTADFDEQPPAAGGARPRRILKPGSFVLLVMGTE